MYSRCTPVLSSSILNVSPIWPKCLLKTLIRLLNMEYSWKTTECTGLLNPSYPVPKRKWSLGMVHFAISRELQISIENLIITLFECMAGKLSNLQKQFQSTKAQKLLFTSSLVTTSTSPWRTAESPFFPIILPNLPFRPSNCQNLLLCPTTYARHPKNWSMHRLRENRKWSAHHALLVEGLVELLLDTSNTCRHLGGFGGSERQVRLLGELGSIKPNGKIGSLWQLHKFQRTDISTSTLVQKDIAVMPEVHEALKRVRLSVQSVWWKCAAAVTLRSDRRMMASLAALHSPS